MKKILKTIVEWQMMFWAKVYIWRTNPQIIVVSGITNRRVFKETIYLKLKGRFGDVAEPTRCGQQVIRVSPENHNAELGIPLSILGLKVTKRSDWFYLMYKAKIRALFGKRVDKIILEVAVDKPNNMDYMLKIFTPNVVVLTNVEPAYMENFGTLDNIAKEYKKLVSRVPKNGLVVLNNDDERVASLARFPKAKVITFSVDNNSDYKAKDIKKTDNGQVFEINNESIELNKFGVHYVLAELAGIVVEDYYK
ncbi:MAG: Mur ligase family protein [bacterium]